ncbi:MAG: hypothetical protein IJ133_02800 [Clostridia bacterium]|nr:hypothetical protein [Clostridia bacterium]
MRNYARKAAAAALALVMMLSVLSVGVFAATPENVKQYKNYLALGDSIGSGFGRPDYNAQGKMVVWGQRIEGAYPSYVADWTGANLTMRHMPGYTSSALRYELDDNYKMNSWEVHELPNFTGDAYDAKFLKEHRKDFQDCVRNADLITLDIGINDTWYSTIALIYYVAEHATNPNLKYGDTRGTLDEELAKYGSWKTVERNALAYLDGFATNPSKWVEFWSLWGQNLTGYITAFSDNYDAIVKNIYRLNPDVTVVAVAGYNPYKDWKITSLDGKKITVKTTSDGQPKVITTNNGTRLTIPGQFMFRTGIAQMPQTMYDMYNAVRQSYTQDYPGKYFYADVEDTEMMGGLAVSLYEFSSMDESGFNPHPTDAGHLYMAKQIVGVLPTR